MLNEESIARVQQGCFSSCFRRPLYDSFCFSRIPATIEYLLTGKNQEKGLAVSCFHPRKYEGVLLLFLDAFGWHFVKQHKEHPFLRRFYDRGIVSCITSQFPSTTAAHVTTLQTGLPVFQTGIYEWFQYEPLVDRMIAPLLYSYAGDVDPGALLTSSWEIADFFPFPTVYQKWALEDVESFVCQHVGICHSPYSQGLSKGAHRLGYMHYEQGLQTIGEVFSSSSAKQRYGMFYHADIDSVGHRKGIVEGGFHKTIIRALDGLERVLIPLLQKRKDSLALLVVADHGMSRVSPRQTLYVNQSLPSWERYLRRDSRGELLVPAGSCRDFFLHVQPEYCDRAQQELQGFLGERAEVWKSEELIQEGIWGGDSTRLQERIGNLVVLPYEGEGVWWWKPPIFEQNFFGAHGGLSPIEMEIPFLFLDAFT